MARKAQKQKQRERLAAEKHRQVMVPRAVFGNVWLLVQILVWFRKLNGVASRDLLQVSTVCRKTREAVVERLSKRVWWTTQRPWAPYDKKRGYNSWKNPIGFRVMVIRLRLAPIDHLVAIRSHWEELEPALKRLGRLGKVLNRVILGGWGAVRARNNVLARKRNYLRWKNGGGVLR